jgi:hypothetical protein
MPGAAYVCRHRQRQSQAPASRYREDAASPANNQLSYPQAVNSLKALCINDIERSQERRCEWCRLARATGRRWCGPARHRWRNRAARWGWRNRPTRRVVVAYPAFMSGQPLLVAGRWLYRLRDGWRRADKHDCRRSRHERRSYIAPYTHEIPYRGRDVWLRRLRAGVLSFVATSRIPGATTDVISASAHLNIGLAVRREVRHPPHHPLLMQASTTFRAPFASAVPSRSRS